MNKKYLSILLCLLCASILTACQPEEKNGKENTAATETAEEGNTEVNIPKEYVSLKEIAGLNGERCKEDREQLHIDAEIDVPEVEEVYQLELRRREVFWENRYQILKDVVGMELAENDPYSYNMDEWMDGEIYQLYEGNPENAEQEMVAATLGNAAGKNIIVDNMGLLKMINMEVPLPWETEKESSDTETGFQNLQESEIVIKERYIGRELTELSKEYTFSDGTVVDAETARAMFDEQAEYFEQYLPNQEIVLKELRVKGTNDGIRSLRMNGGVEYKGMQLCRLPAYLTNERNSEYPFHLGNCMYTYELTSANGAWLNDLIYAYEAIAEAETYDELLSLDTAEDILLTHTAGNKKVNISEISLEYLISYPQDKNELLEKEIVYEGKPAWRFTEELEKSSDSVGEAEDNKYGNVFYIDAVTGEFFNYENMIY